MNNKYYWNMRGDVKCGDCFAKVNNTERLKLEWSQVSPKSIEVSNKPGSTHKFICDCGKVAS